MTNEKGLNGHPVQDQPTPLKVILEARTPGITRKRGRRLEVLIVEDNPGDVELLRTAFASWEAEARLTVVGDGEEALQCAQKRGQYANHGGTDLILLDLNLPGKSGIDVLTALKTDPTLQQIPVVVLTSSDSNADVSSAYRMHANCYLTKSMDMHEYFGKIRALEEFWLTTVRLPSDERGS